MLHADFRKIPVERLKVNIDMKKTGELIKRAVKESGYSIKEIMKITGVSSEQAVYKWFRGESIPSTETQIALCLLFGFQITELIVIDDVQGPTGTLLKQNREGNPESMTEQLNQHIAHQIRDSAEDGLQAGLFLQNEEVQVQMRQAQLERLIQYYKQITACLKVA